MKFLYRTIEDNLCFFPIATTCFSCHIHLLFLSIGKMNSGENGSKDSRVPSGSTSSRFHFQVGGQGPSRNDFDDNKGKRYPNIGQTLLQNKNQSASDSFIEYSYDEEYPPLGKRPILSSKDVAPNKRKMKIDLGPEQKTDNFVSPQLEDSTVLYNVSQSDVSFPSIPFQNKGLRTARVKPSWSRQGYSEHRAGTMKFESSDGAPNIGPFDIGLSRRRNYSERSLEMTRDGMLRPGMVLLKYFLSIREQIQIVRICQELGKGSGGFYQPCYNDGAKLCLQMMCLGLNWDPQTREYDKLRSVDGCEAPSIPHEFSHLVQRAISEAHSLIKKDFELRNVEDVLPSMSPDVCIVNFYKINGRLGLHKDRDESEDSLKKGLPVVSFSVGNSAEFLYGDERDVEKAEKVLLESGDVLIFGGESRHIFHGVSSIIPKSTPRTLLDNTTLRPGRLNLTFRQY